MTITNYPTDWRDLQNKVGEILTQCNFGVEIERVFESIRGDIEIDVFATEVIDGRTYSIICECKYWSSNIPQLYVQALRTIVDDTGVNKAYVITTSNFQTGAQKSAKFTNVELIDWAKFQTTFFKSWYINYFSIEFHKIVKSDYDKLSIQFFEDWSLITKSEFKRLTSIYECLVGISYHFPLVFFELGYQKGSVIADKLPLIEKLNHDIIQDLEWAGNPIPQDILSEKNYGEFLIKIKSFAAPVYRELDKLDLEYSDE